MNSDNDYIRALQKLYNKSLILHDFSLFHPVLYFYYIDALAHLDYSISILAYNWQSPKNIMNGEYLRWRIDEEKKGDRARFGEFINWLKVKYPEKFNRLPTLWQRIYDKDDIASYRSFRIDFDPDNRVPTPVSVFHRLIDEFFDKEFLKSLYEDASLSRMLKEFLGNPPEQA